MRRNPAVSMGIHCPVQAVQFGDHHVVGDVEGREQAGDAVGAQACQA